jgi:hypothetical protein
MANRVLGSKRFDIPQTELENASISGWTAWAMIGQRSERDGPQEVIRK